MSPDVSPTGVGGPPTRDSTSNPSAAREAPAAQRDSSDRSPRDNPSASGEQRPDETAKKLRESVDLLNKTAMTLNHDIEFKVLEGEGIVQARIKNEESGELIRAIPSDEILLIRKKIDAFLGLFVDTFK